MAYRYLHFVRHGQYFVKLHDQGSLTPDGEAQARATADALKSLTVHHIYHSTMLRAQQTAHAIAEFHPDVPLMPTDLLRECIPSIPPGMDGALKAVVPDLTIDSAQRCEAQLANAFSRFFIPPEGKDDVHDLLVCHGNVIRYMVARTMDMHIDSWVRMMIYNCGISKVMIDEDGDIFLVSHNETGHLTLELRTHT